MEKREMPNLGIETSLLGYGCMRFPTLANGEINEEEAQKQLDKAISAGVNYIDTAYPYHNGKSETFVGKALKKYPRDSYYLATKLPTWMVHKKEDVEKLFEEQLGKLQTDYVDFYLLHAIGRDRWREMVSLGVVEACEKLKAEGRIKYFGFSFHDSYEAFEEIINAREWDFCQIQLNYMDTNEQAGLKGYQLAVDKGVPLVIMEPVKGGSLAKFAPDIELKYKELNPKASVASFALRWVGSLPGVKVILSGMTTMEQVEDNLQTFNEFVPLSEKEDKTIQEVKDLLNSRVQNGCTGCGYCMPCPAGVDIPGNFRTWNTYHMYQNYNVVRFDWENGLGEKRQAKNCVKCGKCEAQCPQKIAIREDLEKVQKDLDEKKMIL